MMGVITAVEATKVTSRELVTGTADGVTEVKATTELKEDGTMHTESQYLKKGEWVPGHGAIYRETPEAKVVFKEGPVRAANSVRHSRNSARIDRDVFRAAKFRGRRWVRVFVLDLPLATGYLIRL